jgi:hypothetical protein
LNVFQPFHLILKNIFSNFSDETKVQQSAIQYFLITFPCWIVYLFIYGKFGYTCKSMMELFSDIWFNKFTTTLEKSYRLKITLCDSQMYLKKKLLFSM